MNIQHYLFLLLRYSWLVILVMAGTLAYKYAQVSKQTPVYASRAVLEIEMEQDKVVQIQDVKDNRITGLDAVNTVIQSLTNNTLMLAVARAIGRADEWAQLNPSGKITPEQEGALAQSVRSQLSVSLRRGTRLLDILAEDGSPEKARALADQVIKQFLLLQSQDRTDSSRNANTFLVSEANKLRTKLEESEKKLAQYRIDSKEISVKEGQNLVVARLTSINGEVTAARSKRASIESDLAALKQIPPTDTEGMLRLNSVAALPEVAAFRSALASEESAFAAIKDRYLPLHPKYQAVTNSITDLRAKLKLAIAKAGEALNQQYKIFLQSEDNLKKMLAEQESEVFELDKTTIPYDVLKREAETDRGLYETILTRLKETDVTQGLTKSPYRINEEPIINPIPVRPDRNQVMVSAAIMGLVGGLGLVFLLDKLDSTMRTVDDAEATFGLPVLAAVPDSDLSKLPRFGTTVSDDSGSAPAEAFRTLRSSLSLLGSEDQRRLILVTSAIPSEGKTFTSTNLAAAFATQGLRTLLIDADLRRPALSASLVDRNIRKEDDFRGLTDVLSNLCKPEEAIRETRIANLFLLPSGRRAPNPAELLGQASMTQLMHTMADQYDRVIVDSAPVNAVGDTLCLAPQVHAVCLVVRFGKTQRRATLRALTVLQNVGARMAGLVMNRMPSRRGASYYYYYYGDPYTSDSVYGEGKKGKKGKGAAANA